MATPAQVELLEKYRPLVTRIVNSFMGRVPRSVGRDDLTAAGMGGLWDAVRNDSVGDRFEWYACTRIRGAVIDELRAQDWLPRYARSKQDPDKPTIAVVRFDDAGYAELAAALALEPSAESALSAHESAVALNRAVMTLPERERYILERYYYLGDKLLEIASDMGISQPRASQIRSRALGRLRSILSR